MKHMVVLLLADLNLARNVGSVKEKAARSKSPDATMSVFSKIRQGIAVI